MARIISELVTFVVMVYVLFGLIIPVGLNSKNDIVVVISQLGIIVTIGYFVYYICRIIKIIKRRIEE